MKICLNRLLNRNSFLAYLETDKELSWMEFMNDFTEVTTRVTNSFIYVNLSLTDLSIYLLSTHLSPENYVNENT